MIEMGTLVYLKDREMLYKYIVQRTDTKKIILEIYPKLAYRINSYEDFTAKEIEKNAIFDINVIKKEIAEQIKAYKENIDELKGLKTDISGIKAKINQLSVELTNLEKVEEKTENQIKTIAHLNKAIRRQNSKMASTERIGNENKTREIRKLEDKIENLKEIQAIVRRNCK